MASSLGVGFTGTNNGVARFGIDNQCSFSARAPPPMSVTFVGDQSRTRRRKGRITATAAASTLTMAPAMATTGLKNLLSLESEPYGTCKSDSGEGKDDVDASDRVDKWMRDSVVEIVKNLREAPLLVHVFSKRNSESGGTTTSSRTATLVTEKKAKEEDWPAVEENWRAGEKPSPEGLILVEELAGDTGEKEGREAREMTTKVWGVLVQGRRVGCGPVCYLLRTTRVGLGPMGPWCTHYCLKRVKNYMETVDSQFKNLWLVQGQGR